MNVFVITAEHFHVPGLILQVYATRERAVVSAVDLVNVMWRDSGKSRTSVNTTTVDNWESRLAILQDEHGAAYCYVDITETPLIYDGARSPETVS